MNLRRASHLKPPVNMVVVPGQFRFQDPHCYPQDNKEDFEWWLTRNLRDTDIPTGLTYLPVTWTAYYKKCNYGQDKAGMDKLQQFLDALDKNKKYFTFCQWDDGIINSVGHLDLFQFNMGAPGHYQLPLICQPHQYQFPGIEKDIVCSFIGRITHPIRQKIVNALKSVPRYYISTEYHQLPEYCKILARSKYVIAARGYGATSFRLAEALQYGACPVYVSDVHLRPHGAYTYIEASENDIPLLSRIEKLFADDIWDKFDPKKERQTYEQYFTYPANKQLIIEQLKRMV